jgi:hypothetical protein
VRQETLPHMTTQPIHKTSFRVFKTNDARTLIEHPVRIDANGNEPTQMLVITDNGITVGGPMS